MTKIVSRQELKGILQCTNGAFFKVTFIKRTNGEVREMTCRTGVKKHTTGAGAKYNFTQRDLLPVWEPAAEGEEGKEKYRCVNLSSIISAKVGGEEYLVKKEDIA